MNIPFKKTKEPTDLDMLIERIADMISIMEITDEGYSHAIDQYTKLKAIQANQAQKPISKDALLAAGVNLAGILIIVSFERTHALTSKAIGFVFKTKTTS